MNGTRGRPSRLAMGILVGLLSLSAAAARAEGGFDHCAHGGKQTFSLTAGGDLVGENYYASALKSDSLHDIACRYNIGVEEMFMANDPLNIDHWSPGEGTRVMIPQRFILPDAPRAGVIVNIPEMRLYYFPVKYAPVVKKAPPPKSKPKPKPLLDAKGKPKLDAKGKPIMVAPPPPPPPKPAEPAALGEPIGKAAEVITYPISMGRMDWRTPLGKARVIAKVKDPTWTPPESIRREHAAKGDILPAVVPAGPENPLGRFAMRLSVPGYLIHGTEENYKSFGIGMRVTHGCMRMYNEDVARLFPMIDVGTPVYLVNQPVKLGWDNGTLYMEVSQPLDEDVGIPPEKEEEDMTEAELAREEAKTPEQRKEEKRRKDAKRSAYLMKVAMELIQKETAKRPATLDREMIEKAIAQPTGMVVAIGREQLPLEAAPGSYAPDQTLSDQVSVGMPRQAAPGDATDGAAPSGRSSEEPPYGSGRDEPANSYPDYPYGSESPPSEPYYSAPESPSSAQSGRNAAEPWEMAPSDSGQPAPGAYEPEPSAPPAENPDPYAPDESSPLYQPEGGR
jgi:L,D-transpeptidase ErfK/SrfK